MDLISRFRRLLTGLLAVAACEAAASAHDPATIEIGWSATAFELTGDIAFYGNAGFGRNLGFSLSGNPSLPASNSTPFRSVTRPDRNGKLEHWITLSVPASSERIQARTKLLNWAIEDFNSSKFRFEVRLDIRPMHSATAQEIFMDSAAGFMQYDSITVRIPKGFQAADQSSLSEGRETRLSLSLDDSKILPRGVERLHDGFRIDVQKTHAANCRDALVALVNTKALGSIILAAAILTIYAIVNKLLPDLFAEFTTQLISSKRSFASLITLIIPAGLILLLHDYLPFLLIVFGLWTSIGILVGAAFCFIINRQNYGRSVGIVASKWMLLFSAILRKSGDIFSKTTSWQ